MERERDITDSRRSSSLSSSSLSSSSSSSDSDSSSLSASSSSASFSSSSSDASGSRDSRNPSKKRRRPSKERARTRSNKRRSSDKDVKQKRGKDRISRYDRGKSLKKKMKRHHNSDGNCDVSFSRSQKKVLKQKKRKGAKEGHRSEKQPDSRADKKRIGQSADCNDEIHLHKKKSNTSLQLTMELREQQKALIRHNAELAKARLASGELQRARDEQIKMQQLYGSVDWRAKKRLRNEKKILERTVAAGNKLATFEQRENARMDAFRVALGLPTVEAQRQAEWRAEATQALIELESQSNHGSITAAKTAPKSSRSGIIGPSLPP